MVLKIRCCLFFPLEAVHLQLVMLYQTTVDQHLADFLPLVPLQLHNLSVLRVIDYGPVARKLLLRHLYYLLEVIFRRKTLNSGQRFPSVPLLDPYVHDPLLPGFLVTLIGVCEGVEGSEIVQQRHRESSEYLLSALL